VVVVVVVVQRLRKASGERALLTRTAAV